MLRPDHCGHVLVVDDNRQVADLLADYLGSQGFSVALARDGLTGLLFASTHPYDAIVLGGWLPGLDGLEVCRQLREAYKVAAPILILSSRGALDDKINGLEAGADDYMVKPFDTRELEARLRALIRRSRRQNVPNTLVIGDLKADPDTLLVSRAGVSINLSPVTMKLLIMLMRESPRTVTRREVEREIWGDNPASRHTLRSHLFNLRTAIDKPFDRPLLHTVKPYGYRLSEDLPVLNT